MRAVLPNRLVSHAQAAEQAGFSLAVMSDHFNPWLDEQGHSPNAWVTLGAVANATEQIELMTYVTCPIGRYHPVSWRNRPRRSASSATDVSRWVSGRARTSTSTSSARAGTR